MNKSFLDNILSNKVSAYRKGYSSHHVLIKLTEEWRKMLDNNKIVGVVLMDLSKAFDCLPHELLIAKLSSYGVQSNTLKLLYSYLTERKQAVDIKGKLSNFTTVLAGVPQGSILGPVLFNIFINDMIYIFETCDVNNFADDNGISTSAESVSEVINNLENDSFKAISWFKENKMIANPSKFDAMIMKKDGTDISGTLLNIGDKEIETSNKIKLLGLTIDDKLSFKEHISIICKKAANQLNALKRLGTYINFETKEKLAKAFITSHFNYCPIVWHFCGKGDIHKIEELHERVLRFVYNDYNNDYLHILQINGESTMFLQRIRKIASEVYKTINGLNPSYMLELLSFRNRNLRRPHDLYIPRVNQIKFGYRSYRFEAPSVWNSLPIEIRLAENFSLFKKLIKYWEGPMCRCNFCRYRTEQF